MASDPANQGTASPASPSAYNAATGTLEVHQDGLNTNTRVAEDGRVDINIHEIDARLADQIEQLRRNELESRPSLACATSSQSSFFEAEKLPPPQLNVVIHVVGSRGDVQPFVALGQELKYSYGHRVRLATHGTFKKFVEENGLEFFDIGGDPAELMAFMVKNPGLIPGVKSLKEGEVGKRQKAVAGILEGCWRSCADHAEAEEEERGSVKSKPFIANAIIANPPSFAHIHCAEKLGIPLHLMFTMPWSPTQSFPHPLANIQHSNASRGMTNEMSYTLVDMMTWEGLGGLVNKFRTETLKLNVLTQAAAISALHRLHIPYTYCWSPALIPKPKDWGPNITISGFYFLNLASNYRPDPELAHFLASGPPPVYIGFGSIVVEDPNAMTKMIFEAVRKTGQRALVSKGWGGLGGDELSKPDGVFMLGNCPHDWLFKHVSCVVHHGGAGTTAAGIALGRPTLVVPFFGDQPFWGAMVARAGAGPTPIPFKALTSDGLAKAILQCLRPETLKRAKELGYRIREEKGCEAGAASFHAQMHINKLRCMFSPTRVAVWEVKTKGRHKENIRLSAFAATVLENEGLLDVDHLALYRPCSYPVEENFMVANVSGANPVISTMGSFAHNLVHRPIYIAQAYSSMVTEPFKGARADGLKGFGKGLAKGLGNVFFPRRALITVHGQSYNLRALYNTIKKKMGSDTHSFILAAHFAEGVQATELATEEEKLDVLKRWKELAPELAREQSGESVATLGNTCSSSSMSSTVTLTEMNWGYGSRHPTSDRHEITQSMPAELV